MLFYRKAKIARVNFPAAFLQANIEKIAANNRRKTCCIRVNDKKQRGVRKQFAGFGYQRKKIIFRAKDLAVCAASIAGGIHYNTVITVATPLLTQHKFQAIVRKDPDMSIAQPR